MNPDSRQTQKADLQTQVATVRTVKRTLRNTDNRCGNRREHSEYPSERIRTMLTTLLCI